MKRLEGYRNFCNKLWNASRFVLMNTEGNDCGFNGGEMTLSLADRWILAEFNQTVKAYRDALDSFRFDIAAGILYEFTWNQFCDWYLELTKPVMTGVPSLNCAAPAIRWSPYWKVCCAWRTDHPVHHRNHLAAREGYLWHYRRYHYAAAVPGI